MVLVAVSASTAFAGVGNYSYETVNKIKYYFYSSTYGNDDLAWSGTTVGTVDHVNVPGGWMGVKPKLYNSNGKLVFSSEWYFSEKACAEIYCRAGETSDKGTYYAVGNVKLYNSNGGYDSFNTMRSPYVTLSSESEDIEIERNNNGEIYGSEYFLNQIGIQPDLIATIGDNGIHGFVKNSDLNYDLTPASPNGYDLIHLLKCSKFLTIGMISKSLSKL